MRPGFFTREALRSIGRNAIPSFAALASIAVTVLVLGVFIPVVQATTGAANEVRGRVLVNVFMTPKATDSDTERVRQLLLETDGVGKIDYLSKDEALASETKKYPQLYQLLPRASNPLGATFRVTPKDPDDANKIAKALAPPAVSGPGVRPVDPAIAKVRNREDDTNKILTATRVVKLAMGALAILLIIASVLLVSNTIRLSLFSRRREVEVMKLVGATDWFIRWPFVLEGIALGAVGGVLAIGMLGVGKVALIDPLAADFALIEAPETINFGVLAFLLLAASVLVSAAGSGLSLRRFLRV
jgi:cell division transport system permease protein